MLAGLSKFVTRTPGTSSRAFCVAGHQILSNTLQIFSNTLAKHATMTCCAPACFRAFTQASDVAPLVITSSTRITLAPFRLAHW